MKIDKTNIIVYKNKSVEYTYTALLGMIFKE